MRGAISVEELLSEQGEELSLELLSGIEGLERLITVVDINRPGLALSGYLDHFAFERIQVLGRTELSYLSSLTPKGRAKVISLLLSYQIPCVIISRNLSPPIELLEEGSRRRIPIIRSSLRTTALIGRLTLYLERRFSPRTTVHGVLMDIHGIGTLIIGKSGIGKSECALELIRRGHRLVADDIVHIRKDVDGTLVGSGSELIKHHMEVRGLGIVNVRNIFGIGSVRNRKPIELVISLEDWDSMKDSDRIGAELNTYTILGVDIPYCVIPVSPGRNIPAIIETAALNLRLRKAGENSARDLQRKIMEAISTYPEEDDHE
jgi:HPr kinase/phosphorylase